MNYQDPKYHHLVGIEWDYYEGRTDLGVGDLVFSSSSSFRDESYTEEKIQTLVIEAKYFQQDSGRTARVRRTKHRSKVREQLTQSIAAWERKFPSHEVIGAILSNEGFSSDRLDYNGKSMYLSIQPVWKPMSACQNFSNSFLALLPSK